MNNKKIVPILIAVVLMAFGVGLLSLNHYGYSTKGIDFQLGKDNTNIKIGPGLNFSIDNSTKDYNSSNLIEKNVDEEKVEKSDGVTTIDINVPFSDINIIPKKRNDIKIHYHGHIKANYIPNLETEKSNTTLYISLENNRSNSYNTETIDAQLDIYIPDNYKDKIIAQTSYGNIEIENLTGQFDVQTNYGDIIMKNISGEVIAETSYGNIELEYNKFNDNIEANTSFGDINIILPSDSQFNIDARTSLGDIDINFPVTITQNERDRLNGSVGSSSNNIDLETSMGDIEIISK